MEYILLIIMLILQIGGIGLYYKWESYNKKKKENLAIKEDPREIDYEKEKGKNLATKEDRVLKQAIEEYSSLLKILYKQDFYLKFDFAGINENIRKDF